MEELPSAKLLTAPIVPTAPASKNFTSLLDPGEPLGDQLAATDQLVLAPAGVQVLTGSKGGARLIVTTNVFVIGVTLPAGGFVFPTIVTV